MRCRIRPRSDQARRRTRRRARRQRRALPRKARAAHAGPCSEGYARSAWLIRHAGRMRAPWPLSSPIGAARPVAMPGRACDGANLVARRHRTLPLGDLIPVAIPFSSLRTAAAIVPLHPISSGESPRFRLTLSTWSTTLAQGEGQGPGMARFVCGGAPPPSRAPEDPFKTASQKASSGPTP